MNRALVVGTSSLLVAACSQCNNSIGPNDAATADVANVDVGVGEASAEAGDSGVSSDWPGWQRETAFDPACSTDTPIDPAKAMPTLSWMPCSTGRANCDEFDLTQMPHPAWGGGSSARVWARLSNCSCSNASRTNRTPTKPTFLISAASLRAQRGALEVAPLGPSRQTTVWFFT